MTPRSALRLAVVGSVALLPATLRAQDGYNAPSKVPLVWNQLNSYDQVIRICNDLAGAYPELLTLEVIGKSVQGRDMIALTLNVAATGPADTKPAMYIDGNIHGNEVQGTEAVLYSIWYLTKSYGKVPQLTELMNRAVFYFVPMVNPDGRAYWFDAPNTMHSSRSGQKPLDNDGDGLFDEDPPNDLDGDGLLLEMRRVDPNGRWRESPDDPRILIPVDPESRGDFRRFSRLGQEGVDDDGDGQVNEDGPGGYDPNRNWPADWQPNFIQFGAGDYPLSLPESKCIADFVLRRPNIAAVQAYHNSGGMILRGPGAKEIEYPESDIHIYDRIGQRGEQMLPFYRYMVIWKDLYTVHGGFVNWTYDDLGIISFTNELWTDAKYFSNQNEGEGRRRDRSAEMLFNDYLMFGQTYTPWKPAKHPVYGDVEVGGWSKMWGRVPPSFHLEEECHRNFAFTVYHAEQMPLLELRDVEVAPLGDGLLRVRVDAHNRRLIPTTTAQGAKRRHGPRDFVRIRGENLRVLAGGTVADRFSAPFDAVEHQPHQLWIDDGIPGESFRTFQWIVTGGGTATIELIAPRAVDVSTTVALP